MSDDKKRVHRQALAGMLWSKQYYLFDVDTNFSDVNPPVHAWATLYLFHVERSLGREDIPFLERSFHALALDFNWWLNRKDPDGRTVFAGGFLGLDNIGVFDRSAAPGRVRPRECGRCAADAKGTAPGARRPGAGGREGLGTAGASPA